MSLDTYNFFLLLTIIFLFLPVVWTLTDSTTPSERFKAYFRLKSFSFLLAELLIIWTTFFSVIYFPWPKTLLSGLITIFGLFFYFTGIFIAVWAKVTMKSSWGMPAEHDIKRQKKIIKKGPFAFSRNPIYVGLILVILGYSLALKSYSVLLVPLVTLYFYKAALKEEKILTKYFGKEYLEYKSRVRRFV